MNNAQKAVQQGRSEQRGESYCGPYGEPLIPLRRPCEASDTRTPLAVFYRILLSSRLPAQCPPLENARHQLIRPVMFVARGVVDLRAVEFDKEAVPGPPLSCTVSILNKTASYHLSTHGAIPMNISGRK